MPRLLHYIINAGPGQPGRNAKGTDPRTLLRKSVRPKVQVFNPSSSRQEFKQAPYDWEQIDKAVATDSYISQALLKYKELMWKESYDLKSAVPESLVYIKQRMKVLGLSQAQSFDMLLQEIGENLVKYHNCFVVKARDPEVARIAGLNVKGLDGKDPIAGYFVAATKTITISYDEVGRVTGYKQEVRGSGQKPVVFKPEDVIHITYNRPTGQQWGVPFLDSSLEDVRAFRIIEEDMLNIVHSEIYTMLHYAVNGKKPEWPVDDEDIAAAYAAVEDMKGSGVLVSKGADTLEPVDKGSTSLDVDPYIKHFKERAIVSLGLSPHHLGVASDLSKGSTDRLDAALYDKVKGYQFALEDAINNQIFFELLIEGGLDPLSAQKQGKNDPTVFFEFKEIDVEAQIKRENHTSVLWLQNMLTHAEMRTRIGMIVDPEEAEKYHIDMVELPLTEASKAMQAGANPNSPAKGTSGSSNNPANQRGNRGGPKMSRSSWEELEERVVDAVSHNDEEAVKELLYVNEGPVARELKLLINHAIDTTEENDSIRIPLVRASFRALDHKIAVQEERNLQNS